MSEEELLGELGGILQRTEEQDKLRVIKEFLAQRIPNQRVRSIVERALIIGIQLGSRREHVVALVHGIRTHANWQERVRHALESSGGVQVYPIGYGYLDTLRFWFPFFTRSGPIKRVLRELRGIRAKHIGADISVVAHSFGTYIVGTILRKKADVVLLRMLLCGSVLPQSFRWDEVPRLPKERVVNEVGTRDVWPVLARAVSWGYGASGTFGFKTHNVLDRFHDVGHSDFFKDEHISNFWTPFVLEGKVIDSAWDSKRTAPSALLSFLSWFPCKSAIVLLLGVTAFWLWP